MAGKFEIYVDRGGKYRFRLKAANGETILASQGYVSRSGAMNGVRSVQKHCSDKACFQTKTTPSGHRFNLVAHNNRVIGTSETYKTAAACANGVASVARSAPGATIVKV